MNDLYVPNKIFTDIKVKL